MTLEVCVDGYESFKIAQSAGADRIELCSALNLGGLTPSHGLMKQVSAEKGIQIFIMIRPRSGSFFYTVEEYETMKADIDTAKDMGFDGIVIGFLKEDNTLDLKRLAEVVKLAKPLKVVLHRAFDDAKHPENDISDLIDMGICRILTSGQKEKALDGVDYIHMLQERYGNQIAIMPGSGVNSENIKELYDKTGCRNYHLSGRTVKDSVEKADYDKIKRVRMLLDVLTQK